MDMTREEVMKKVEFGVGYLKIKEFAILSGWSESTVRRYEERGVIPPRVRLSFRLKGWPVKDVISMIENVRHQE